MEYQGPDIVSGSCLSTLYRYRRRAPQVDHIIKNLPGALYLWGFTETTKQSCVGVPRDHPTQVRNEPSYQLGLDIRRISRSRN